MITCRAALQRTSAEVLVQKHAIHKLRLHRTRSFILGHGLVPCNPLTLRQASINSFRTENARAIHTSAVQQATHAPNAMLEYPSNSQRSNISRQEQVSLENKDLWHHVGQLIIQEKPEMAASLCRERLKDPLAHIPSPATASVDELRTTGYYFLSLALNIMYYRDPSSDAVDEDEMLDALRKAAEGISRYGDNKETQASILEILSTHLTRRDDIAEFITVMERVAWLLRDIAKEAIVSTNPETLGKTPVERLFNALQSLASIYAETYQSTAAVRVVDEAIGLIPELQKLQLVGPEAEVTTLCYKAQYMELANTGEYGSVIVTAWEKLQKLVQAFSEENNCTAEEVLIKSEELCLYWTMSIWMMDSYLSDAEWRGVFPGGETRRELLTKANDYAPKLSKLPANLRDTIPDDFQPVVAYIYNGTLSSLAPRLGSYAEEVAMLEKAFEVVLIQALPDLMKAPKSFPASLPYADFRKHFKDILLTYSWSFYSLGVLIKLGIARLNLLQNLERKDREVNSLDQSIQSYDECMRLLGEEIEFGLRVATQLFKSMTIKDARKAIELSRAQLLLLRGRMEVHMARRRGMEDGHIRAKELWEEARRVLISVEDIQTNGFDAVEKERLEEIRNAEKLLDGTKDA